MFLKKLRPGQLSDLTELSEKPGHERYDGIEDRWMGRQKKDGGQSRLDAVVGDHG